MKKSEMENFILYAVIRRKKCRFYDTGSNVFTAM